MRSTDSRVGPHFFFLAYAHTPERRWVEKLFADVCLEVFERSVLKDASRVGFMDQRDIPLGSDWRAEVFEALATCQVFVPLYSPRYFTRTECGYEWNAFAERILDHQALAEGKPTAIVPAIWTPVSSGELPEVARRIQMNHADLGPDYAREGFYTLIKNRLYRHQYLRAVQRLAQHIVDAARESQLRPFEARDFGPLRNVFQSQTPAPRRLTIVVAAPSRDRLPFDRTADFYGGTACEWNPYHPRSRQPIADYALGIARLNSYEPRVLDFDDGYSYLSGADGSSGPALVLVDPWAATESAVARRLHELDKRDLRWMSVLVPWNTDDAETAARADWLLDSLRRALPRRLGDGGATAQTLTWRVAGLEQFRARLPDVLEAALIRYATSVDPPSTAGDDTTDGDRR